MKHLRRTSAMRTLGAGCLAVVATLGLSLPALADDATPSLGTTVDTSTETNVTTDALPLPEEPPAADTDNGTAKLDDAQAAAPSITVSAAPLCGVKATFAQIGRGKIIAFRHDKVNYLESKWASRGTGTTRANRGTPNGTVVAQAFHADRTPVIVNGQPVISAPFTVTGCGDVPTVTLKSTAFCTDDAGRVRSQVAVTANEQRLLRLVVRSGGDGASVPVSQSPFVRDIKLRAGVTSTASLSFRVLVAGVDTGMPTRTYTVALSLGDMPKCSEPRIVKGAYGVYCTRNGLANPIVRWETDNTVTNRAISAARVNPDGTLGERTAWAAASQDLLTAPLALTPGTYRLFAQYTMDDEVREQRVDTTDFSIGDRACPIDIAAQVGESCTNGLRDVTLTALTHSSLEPRQYKLFGATNYSASQTGLTHTFSVIPGRYYPQIVDNTWNFATSTPVIQVPAC